MRRFYRASVAASFAVLLSTAASAQQPVQLGGTGASNTGADDRVLVGTGSGSFVEKALVACTGTNAAMQYDAAGNAFGCATVTGGHTVQYNGVTQATQPILNFAGNASILSCTSAGGKITCTWTAAPSDHCIAGACALNAGTTVGGESPCLEDGTNCPAAYDFEIAWDAKTCADLEGCEPENTDAFFASVTSECDRRNGECFVEMSKNVTTNLLHPPSTAGERCRVGFVHGSDNLVTRCHNQPTRTIAYLEDIPNNTPLTGFALVGGAPEDVTLQTELDIHAADRQLHPWPAWRKGGEDENGYIWSECADAPCAVEYHTRECHDTDSGRIYECECPEPDNCGMSLLATVANLAGHQVRDEATVLAQQPYLRFNGAGVTCTDDDPNSTTVCDIPGGGSGGHTIEEDGTPLTARTGLNFTGPGITCADDSGNDETDCAVPGNPLAFDENNDAANESAAITQITCIPDEGVLCDEPSPDVMTISLDDSIVCTTCADCVTTSVKLGGSGGGCLRENTSTNIVWRDDDCDGSFEDADTILNGSLSHATDCTSITCNAALRDVACIDEDDDKVWWCEDDGSAAWVQINAPGGSAISFDATNDSVNESTSIDHIECNGNGLACAEANADEARIALDIGTSSTQVAAGDHTHTGATISTLDAADTTSGSFADARVDGSLEADEVNPTLGTQTQGNYVADVDAGSSGKVTVSGTPSEGWTPVVDVSASVENKRVVSDCTALTDGESGEWCEDAETTQVFICVPTAGACDTGAEWKDIGCASGCSDGEVCKKSSGRWGCAADNAGALVDEPFTMYVCHDGTNAAPTPPLQYCNLGEPCRDGQYAMNRITEQGDTTKWSIQYCVGNFNDDADVWPLRTWNTDASSAQYLKKAIGVKIKGAGPAATVWVCDYLEQTEGCAGGLFDVTGARSVIVQNLSMNSGIGDTIVSAGGTTGLLLREVGLSGVGGTRLRMRGLANEVNGFHYAELFNLNATYGGTSSRLEIGFSSDLGQCSGAAFPYAACSVNADCGGRCDSGAATTAKIGDFCRVDADCGAGSPGSTCDFAASTTDGRPRCSANSLDVMNLGTFHQTEGANVTQLIPRTCVGGATALGAGTVTVDHDDTCSGGVCATLAGSLACDSDADCQSYVVGSGTSFTSAAALGERIIIGAEERSIRRVHSNTLMEVTNEWTASASGSAASISNDGFVCSTNADCDTSGVCTKGSGTGFEEHWNNAVFLTGGTGGLCGDANGEVAWPTVGCRTDWNFCVGGSEANSYCTVDGNCDGGGTCPNECTGSLECLSYAIYAEGSNTKLRLRDTTLTTTNVGGTSLDNPTNQIRVANNAEVQIQGGSVEVEGSSSIDDELKTVTGGTVSGNTIVLAKYLIGKGSVTTGDGTDTGDKNVLFDDDRASSALFQWDNTNEAFVLDSLCASNTDCASNSVNGRTTLRFERNGSLGGLVHSYVFSTVPHLDFWTGGSTGDVRILNSDGTIVMLTCSDNDSDFCNFPVGIKQEGKKLPDAASLCGGSVYIPLPSASYTAGVWSPDENVTITKIRCKAFGTSTPTVNLDLVNDDTTDECVNSNDASPDDCSTPVACTGTLLEDTSFGGDATVTADTDIGIDITSITGSVTGVRVEYECTVD